MSEVVESSAENCGAVLDTLDYLRGVKSSTCLLLPTTPSPTPLDALDFKHPLSEEMNQDAFLSMNDDQNLQNMGDSSSSADSNSVVQDPVSAQLINHISMLDYHTLSKNGDLIMGQDEVCKLNGSLSVTNRKLPDFVNWNWTIIRKVLLWVVLSGLIACLGAIIAMVVTIPQECNPDLPWYQGKVFYEVFPASFKDSNNDGTGDFKGLIKKLDYIQSLGPTAIRLNSIFEAHNYPDHYYNVTSLSKIDRSIGVLRDFQDLVAAVHDRNMSLILDLPVLSMANPTTFQNSNSTHTVTLANHTIVTYMDQTSAAIAYWARAQNVDGFFLMNLEKFVDDPNFTQTLPLWKQIIGYDKILIASEEAYTKAKGGALNVLLSRIDLIDINLNLQNGVEGLKDRIENVISGNLMAKHSYPWVLWNIGNVNSERVSTKQGNNTLVMTALELILPGTVSLFYGDEIGLSNFATTDIEKDFHGHEYIQNLVPMMFSHNEKSDNLNGILSWNSKSDSEPKYYFLDIIKKLIEIRLSTPTIYLKAIYKEGNTLKNTGVRKTEENLVVIERWYPRRNTCVFVGNLGDKSITTDLSLMFYGGTVIASTNNSLVGQVLYFDQVTFPPYSAMVLKLEK